MTAVWGKPTAKLVWLDLHFGHQLHVEAVRAFITNLVSDRASGRLVLEVESNAAGTTWRIGSSNPQVVLRLAKTHLPAISITASQRHLNVDLSAWRLTARAEGLLVATDDLEAAAASLLGALAVTGKATTVQQIVIGQRLSPQRVPPKPRGLRGDSWNQQLIAAAMTGAEPIGTERRHDLVNKRSIPGAIVTIRLGLHDPQKRYSRLPAGFIAAWRSIATPNVRLDLRPDKSLRLIEAAPATGLLSAPIRLNVDELLTVLAWPYGERSYPRLDRDRSVRLPITTTTKSGRLLGLGTHPGQSSTELHLSLKDALRHVLVTGPSGVGKSTLLANMILADIADNRSLVVIDPKSDLVDDLLARIPQQHLPRTVLLDLEPASRTATTASESSSVLGFNPVAVHPSEVHQAVDGLVHVFKTLHAKSWGPRSEDILHASLLTLALAGSGASLIDIPTLLADPDFRRKVIARATKRGVGGGMPQPLRVFWDWFDDMGSGERSHVIAPLLNKLRPFTLRPSLANILASGDPFRLERIFTERLVLLVPLRKGRVGSEVAQLFGSLLVAELWRNVQTRASISRDRRHPSFIYADEFQDYVALPSDFADVLAQSRGLGVGWTLAHQNFDQLPASLQKAVAANAQSKIYFRLATDDATRVAKTTDQLRPQDFSGLPAFEAYAQVLHRDELTPFASVRTLPLGKPSRDPRAAARKVAAQWNPEPKAAGRQPAVESVERSEINEVGGSSEQENSRPAEVGRKTKKRGQA